VISNFLTVTPTRAVDEANNTRTPIAPIDVVPALHEPQITGERGKRFVQTGELFVRRGSDLKDGDEVPLPQGSFGVIGGAQFDVDHPMTGHNFGWVKYTIRRGG
jgi:hypothetical protein